MVSLRQAKPVGRGKRCNDCTSETLRRGPVGNQSHPVEPASSRKRVLRGGGRLPLRSVDSQAESLDIEPRNFSRREPSFLTQAGAAAARRYGLALPLPPGSKTQANRPQGPRRNLGDLQPPTATNTAAREHRTQTTLALRQSV